MLHHRTSSLAPARWVRLQSLLLGTFSSTAFNIRARTLGNAPLQAGRLGCCLLTASCLLRSAAAGTGQLSHQNPVQGLPLMAHSDSESTRSMSATAPSFWRPCTASVTRNAVGPPVTLQGLAIFAPIAHMTT